MKKKKSITAVIAIFVCAAMLSACERTAESSSASSDSIAAENINYSESIDAAKLVLDDNDYYTEWKNSDYTEVTLNGDTTTAEGDGVDISQGSVTINKGGVYVFSGTLTDGQLIVDAGDDDDVRIILNNADISCSTSSAVYVINADKVIISVPESSASTLSDGESYSDTSEEAPNACVYSKSDLVINGKGSLTVSGNFQKAISGRDDLKITEISLTVNSAEDGIIGKDSVFIGGGSFVVNAQGDGIKSNNDSDTSKGYVYISGGSFDITAAQDGIQAETALIILGGDFNILSNGGSVNADPQTGGDMGFGQGGRQGFEQDNQQTQVEIEEESTSAKGIKSGTEIIISGGTFNIDSADDSIHTNGSITVSGGEFNIETGDDGIHADGTMSISDGEILINKCYEGIESPNIAISGGSISITASDDGINASGESTRNNTLTISGGSIFIEASGDGADINGSGYMTGGTVIINGPENSANSALDYESVFEISGGALIAAGSTGMAMAPSDGSTQNSIAVTLPTVMPADSIIHIEDCQNSIVTFSPSKQYQSFIFSSPDIANDTEYSVWTGGALSSASTDGLYEEADYSGGEMLVSFTASAGVTWVNESGVTEGSQGGMGFGGGQGGTRSDNWQQDGSLPDGVTIPDGMTPPADGSFSDMENMPQDGFQKPEQTAES